MPFIIEQDKCVEVSEEVSDRWFVRNFRQVNSVYLLRETWTVDRHVVTYFCVETGQWRSIVVNLNARLGEDSLAEEEFFPFEQIGQASEWHDEAVEFWKNFDRRTGEST